MKPLLEMVQVLRSRCKPSCNRRMFGCLRSSKGTKRIARESGEKLGENMSTAQRYHYQRDGPHAAEAYCSIYNFRAHFRGFPPGSCLPVARTGAAVKAHPDVVGPAHAHARLGHALEAATPARLGVGGPRLLQRQLAQREHAAQRGHLVRVPYGVRLRCAGLRPPMQPVAASGTPRLQCWAAVLGCSAGLQRRWGRFRSPPR